LRKMFARWARLPLRRCLHTRVPPSSVQRTPFNRLALVLGLSAATATYVTWRLAANDYRIALDSPQCKSGGGGTGIPFRKAIKHYITINKSSKRGSK